MNQSMKKEMAAFPVFVDPQAVGRALRELALFGSDGDPDAGIDCVLTDAIIQIRAQGAGRIYQVLVESFTKPSIFSAGNQPGMKLEGSELDEAGSPTGRYFTLEWRGWDISTRAECTRYTMASAPSAV